MEKKIQLKGHQGRNALLAFVVQGFHRELTTGIRLGVRTPSASIFFVPDEL